MKVGIMSMQRVRNYGSYLQAYGLKKLIEKNGHQVVFVDYMTETDAEKQGTFRSNRIYRLFSRFLIKLRLGINRILSLFQKKEGQGYLRFIRAFEKQYLKELGLTSYRQYRTKVDVLVIGSDEVFNCTQGNGIGFSKELFGKNNQADKVISYAASFGNTTLEKMVNRKIDNIVKKLLMEFSVLSVRDKNSADIVYKLTGDTPQIHFDPVLMYDFAHDIKDVANIRDYIILYAYNNRITEEEGKCFRKFADSKKKKLISISGEFSFCDSYVYCSPLEMLSYFKYADYVITDTFHGTIFSIMNHRQFATLIRRDENAQGYGNQEKLSDLLQAVKLEMQILHSLDDLEAVLEQKIDYDITDKIIEKERIRTETFLKENVAKCTNSIQQDVIISK